MAAGGAALALMVSNTIKGVVPGLLGLGGAGGKGGGGLLTRALGGAGVSHVWVDNMPGSGPGGAPGGPGGKGGAGAKLLGALAAGTAGYALGSAADETFGLSDKIASFADGGANQARAEAGASAHRLRQAKLDAERAMRVRNYEASGMSHGAAVYAASKPEIKNLVVNINGDQATVEADGGTRSPRVMVRRGAAASGDR
jgi:hypothetical protein